MVKRVKGEVGFLRRVGLVEEMEEARGLNSSQVQGKQFIFSAPTLLLLLLFGPLTPPPSSNDQRRKSSLSSLVKRWQGGDGGGYRTGRKRGGSEGILQHDFVTM